MSLSIKSTLIRNNGKIEIRRFLLDDDLKGKSLQAVWEKINKLYGDNLQEKGFALFWKDDDDDDIIMTSDEELITAIKAQKSDVLKLCIQKPRHGRRSSKQDPSELHQGVSCDGCDGEVCGMRYKCLQCVDYDLCSACENKSTHPEHLMIRIPSSSKFGGFPGFPFWMHGGHKGRHGGCGWRRMHRFHQHHKDNASQQSGAQAFHPGEFLERLWNVVGSFVPQAGPRVNPQASSENQNANSSAPPTVDEYLQSVGESVAAMLDPLGIDVTVDVEHNGERKRCEVPTEDSPTKDSQTQETAADEKTSNDVKNDVSPPTPQSPEASSSSENIKQSSFENNTRMSAREYISNLTQVLSNLTVNRDGPSIDPQGHVESDWTYVNYCDKDHDSNASPQNTEVKNVIESEAEIKTEATAATADSSPSHPDPVIALAVDQMMSMGYDNENSWLSTLLELNNGNVDQTIEQISTIQSNGDRMTEFIVALMQKNEGNFDQLMQALQSAKKYCNKG
uniref:Sequestosome-1 n=1 Tax=Hemiscolopendra marginata TaxID=943146 RepID=A0A646QCX9_9MYRI